MTISLCSKCKGSGVYEDQDNWNEETDYICEDCFGTGRVYTTNGFSIPFGIKYSDRHHLNDADNAVYLVRREWTKKLKDLIPVPERIRLINAHRRTALHDKDKYDDNLALKVLRDRMEDFYDEEVTGEPIKTGKQKK